MLVIKLRLIIGLGLKFRQKTKLNRRKIIEVNTLVHFKLSY